MLFATQKGQDWILATIFEEFHDRHPFIQLLTKCCLDRPRLTAFARTILSAVVKSGNYMDLAKITGLACSGLFNLRYYQGVADELSGRAAFSQAPLDTQKPMEISTKPIPYPYLNKQPSMLGLFKQDLQRWVVPGQIADPSMVTTSVIFKLLIRHMQVRAMLLIRFRTWCNKKHIRGFPFIIQRLLSLFYGLEIAVSQEIGGGLYIAHPYGTVIMPTRIGKNCSIVHNVTIGLRNESDFPCIGDNVFIGAGARVLGGIVVGDGAKIGANAVVITNVPPGATMVGVPARENRKKHD